MRVKFSLSSNMCWKLVRDKKHRPRTELKFKNLQIKKRNTVPSEVVCIDIFGTKTKGSRTHAFSKKSFGMAEVFDGKVLPFQLSFQWGCNILSSIHLTLTTAWIYERENYVTFPSTFSLVMHEFAMPHHSIDQHARHLTFGIPNSNLHNELTTVAN